ncbi:trehalose-6-phosphate synthase [Mesorhizobium sp. BAC0120]|uniref:alpha,alpha-trehalose-phosphate synthase (UDP-forming) n=1 Tax=Mesorhizobium sp. BAC0120 TaxID=3090670 RepID=UPI00298C6920|nr:trehalose-6-phosphate synthase [Mesorhizobium sp. BAC0120]MDW6020186.1 trehalose-6-phosphate synthase [Mesorhizobium sp. BAC0120]
MTPEPINPILAPTLFWTIIAASLILSVVAVSFCIYLMRRTSRRAAPPPPVQTQARPLLRETERNGNSTDDALIHWSPEMLKQILASELPDTELIVVSNREPYIHELVNGKIELQVPASGLVSALEPVTRTCAGTWIAHGSGSADRLTVDPDDRIAVPPDKPAYTLRRVWLTEEEYKGYYYGFANEGLWPLCHIAFTRPIFRAADWECYQAVNRKFADVVIEEAKSERPIVLIQDYHFALLPRLIREKLPEAIIITFWHIPWPNSEVFSVCPWRDQILEGLLGSSILGFHIQLHCNNFTESVDRFLESRIDREGPAISYGGQTTLVHSYPISIEWPDRPADPQAIQDARARIFKRYGLSADIKLAVGVERLDYTKGILDRFRALDEFFHQHSDWIGQLTFIQVAAPSRSNLRAYRQLHQECLDLAADINERYGREGYQPIVLLDQHQNHEQLVELFRAADICVVSSLHDGMNLVAKEFVAARDDESGVLVLSAFAGASRELLEALIVNPFDPSALGEAFFQALTMPIEEQRERMRRMREVVRNNNVYRWAGSMLLDAARLRKRVMLHDVSTKSTDLYATSPGRAASAETYAG